MAQESVPPGRTGYQGQEGLLDLEALQQQVALLEADLLTRTRWMGPWVAGDYVSRDQVLDQGWLSIANKDTSERPAPQGVGDEAYIYSGASPVGDITAKSLGVAQRYTADESGYISGYRVYEVLDNEYRVFLVVDPDGVNEITQLISFTGGATAWLALGLRPVLIPAGTVFELWVVMSEPAGTPTTWVGDWDYDTPPQQGVPAAGVVLHSNSVPGLIRFSDLDDAAADRSAELLALTAGDTIATQGVTWTLQGAPTDGGTYVEFAIAPATQAPADGVFTITFETVSATPITTVIDTDYWLGDAAVSGFYAIDGGAPVATEAQYGIDILYQRATVSEDWDLQALTE